MKTLQVNLGERSYPIYLGEGILQQPGLLASHVAGQQVMIVSQLSIAKHYLANIKAACWDYQCDEVVIADGEQHKTLATWEKILTTLLKHQHHRDTTLIALGGGVVGDITGFAAACYQRGAHFIQVPTTLLAQVDASVGGKTAVNHPLGKNMIGAFYQPRAVIIDINTLKTLPEREFRAGMAEVIKTALLADADFFVWLEENIQHILNKDPASLLYAIEHAVRIKARVIAADETEQTGQRALLNLGHTFAHAIETLTHYQRYLHGEAVSIGLVLAAKLSAQQGFLDEQEVTRICCLLKQADLPVTLPHELTGENMLAAMQHDKKMTTQGMILILLKQLGQATLVSNIAPETILQLL